MKDWQQALDRAKRGRSDPNEMVEALQELLFLRFEVAKLRYIMGETAGNLIRASKEKDDETKRDSDGRDENVCADNPSPSIGSGNGEKDSGGARQ